MRIGIVGAGAVGGYFGARLRAHGVDTALLARGPHLAAIRDHGLTVITPDGEETAAADVTDDPEAVGPVDAILIAVKSRHTSTVAATLAPMIGPETIVLSLQNGVDNEEHLATRLGADRVLGGVAFIVSTVVAPGVIRVFPGPRRIVFGELDGSRSDRAERLLDTLAGAALDVELSDNVRAVLWGKLAFICAVAGMTATTRLPLGPIRDDPEAWAMLCRISEEVCAVARAEGVVLPADVVGRQESLVRGLDPNSTSSLARDLAQGLPLEVEAMHGTVVRRGRALGVPVAMNEAVYAILRPSAEGRR